MRRETSRKGEKEKKHGGERKNKHDEIQSLFFVEGFVFLIRISVLIDDPSSTVIDEHPIWTIDRFASFLFRPEFSEFFALNATSSSNQSKVNNNHSQGTSGSNDDLDEPSTPVEFPLISVQFPGYTALFFDLV